QRSYALETLDHAAARGGEHDFGHSVDAKPEPVADNDFQSGGGGCFQNAAAVEKAALLHDLELDDVGAIGADDSDKARMIRNRFIRHHWNSDRLADLRHAAQVLFRNRLLQ